MKLIIAYIQPYKLNDVKENLVKHNIYKMSVTNALGCGQQGGYEGTWKGTHMEVNLLKKIKIEIAVNDDFVQTVIDAIIESAASGNIGDGKIFVLPLEHVVRIRNKDTDQNAIG